MKFNNLIYLTDEAIYLKNKKQKNIIKFKITKGIIKYGKVYHVDKFLKSYSKLLNDFHLNNNLFGDTIKVIINSTYTPADIFFLKTILEKFNYRKIVFEQETKLYKLNNSNAYLNAFNNYSLLSYIDEYKKIRCFLIPESFFPNFDDLLNYIKSKIENKELYLIGNGDKISEILEKFEEKYQNGTYIYSDNEFYLLNSVH